MSFKLELLNFVITLVAFIVFSFYTNWVAGVCLFIIFTTNRIDLAKELFTKTNLKRKENK